ncbi:hypothetical protein PHLCEN_2v2442 [Hermanssonia centrifuga]|uniref:Uncharacterized protein n=1 Tax=Hermanssonia centrifuga TaxID=98765 RepID=A0A2R6RLZ8_9APHY|nr:hypothetical protein PHLCEN_2v2442 [Hermanssonia centrifuga]
MAALFEEEESEESNRAFDIGYTQQAIHEALGTDKAKIPPSEGHTNDKPTDGASRPSEDGHPAAEPRPLEELDLLLPKICEALVLVSQCLISLTLYSEERFSAAGTCAGKEPKLRRFEEHLKDYVNDSMSPAGEGSIECLIGAKVLSGFRVSSN